MDLTNVRLEKKNNIAYVTFDRPKVLNALNMATMGELQEVFTDLAADREIRVVILTGGGEKAFVAGADINELARKKAVEAQEAHPIGFGNQILPPPKLISPP